MRKLYIAGALIAGMAVVTSCSDSHDYALEGEGKVLISASYSNDVKIASRATLEEELSSSTIIWISGTKGLVRKYEGLDNLPADGIKLVSGNYVAEAWAGDSVSASFDSKYYKGRTPFTITTGTTRVELPCRIANVVASVDYDEEVDKVLSDYTLTVGHSRGSLDFVGKDTRKGYFMMPSGSKNLTWKLTGTLSDGTTFTKEDVIENVEPATEYILHVTYTPSTTNNGGAFIEIVVDESTVDSEDEIVITVAPNIVGTTFDVKQGITGQPGMFEKKSLYITAAAALKNVVLESTLLASVIGGNDIDLMTAGESVSASLRSAGIEWTYVYNDVEDISNMKINLNEEWLNTLTVGEYQLKVTATDMLGKSTSVNMPIVVTEAKVEAVEVSAVAPTTWATKATIYGRILDGAAVSPALEYRQSGSTTWLSATTTIVGTDMTAEITGLRPGTTYEYRAVCSGFESAPRSITTESALQLSNASFEEWQVKSGRNATLIYADGTEMFWDSGNHGSATLQKQVTTPDGTYVNSGSYSALLTSQKVALFGVGRFAAGNIFIGQYLKTDGTDGILGWGRQFGSRPKALRGYVRYEPAQITYNDCQIESKKSEMAAHVGETDQGIIYIVILSDDNKMTASSVDSGKNATWPIVVETKSGQIFDVSRPNVIGYGELILDATATDTSNGMVEFEIPINYTKTDVKGANIAITCSASRYGDYFCGGDSKMWIDDFQLVY